VTEPTVSAQVVLRPASTSAAPPELVTSSTIAGYAPPPEAAEAIRRYFERAGFSVGPLVGISFSIEGPPTSFENTFGERPRVEDRRGVQEATTAAGYELSLDRLPPELQPYIGAVTFTPPPDFGPTGYDRPFDG
jgi:hypothetical protein